MPRPTAPVPVTVLAGFLGAGKTTLLNRFLAREGGERVAVVVNEFGDVPVDGRLVVGSRESLIELANGCVCCTVREDLVRTLRDLLRRRGRRLGGLRFERIVLEASGLASPRPILHSLLVDEEIAAGTRPAGVVTLVEAGRLEERLAAHPEVAEQLGLADLVLLNHADRTDDRGLERARGLVRAHNPAAGVLACVRAEVELELLLREAQPGLRPELAVGEAPVAHTPGARALVLRSSEPMDLHRLKMWVQFLAHRRGAEVWRLKGLVACAGHGPGVVVQGVDGWVEVGPAVDPAPDESLLVLIGRELDEDEVRRGWEACRAPAG